jgi:hypothetical protein
MKKFSSLFLALFLVAGSYAQCVVDSSLAVLDSTAGGYYPAPNHLPHIVRDSAYSQTVQGKIETGFSQSFNVPVLGSVTATITVDSVRLDSILGLPAGITWTKSSNTLKGGGIGCIQFSGTTTDTPGRYPINAVGMTWAILNVPPIINNKDTFMYGSLNQLPAYRGYYVVVDSAQSALSALTTSRVSCASLSAGTATVTAAGGSPVDPYTYLWNNGVTSYTVNNLTAGTYYVTVTSGIDTVMDSVVVVADPTPIAITVTSQSVDSNAVNAIASATISVTGGTPPYTYRWNNGDSTAAIDSLAPGTYRVFITDSLGCRQTDSVVIRNLTAGIATTTEIKPQMSLFPNPTHNLLNVLIESPVSISARIEAIDMTGKVVYSSAANVSNHYSQVIDVSKFSNGVYILQLSSENQSIHQRFVVTR